MASNKGVASSKARTKKYSNKTKKNNKKMRFRLSFQHLIFY